MIAPTFDSSVHANFVPLSSILNLRSAGIDAPDLTQPYRAKGITDALLPTAYVLYPVSRLHARRVLPRQSDLTLSESALQGQPPLAIGKLQSYAPGQAFDDVYEYDPYDSPAAQAVSSRAQEQQQPQQLSPVRRVSSNLFSPRPSSSSGTSQTLRRTPGVEDFDRERVRFTSAVPERRPQVRFAEDPWRSSSTAARVQQPAQSPHQALRISPRTLSAILVAVEALRTPYPFTPDLEEELAPMSDLPGVQAGRRHSNGGASRAQGPIPVQTSPASVSRAAVIPPTEIMRRREQRAKEQQERAQQSSQVQGQRLQSEWDQYQGRGASPPQTMPPQAASPSESLPAATSQRRNPQSYRPTQPSATSGYSDLPLDQPSPPLYSPGGPVQPPVQARPAQMSGLQAQVPEMSAPQSRPRARSSGQPRPVPSAQPGASGAQFRPTATTQAHRESAAAALSGQAPLPRPTSERRRVVTEPAIPETARKGDGSVSSFPHAFERWEMLSSRWEGMTSSWISRLEMNAEELQNQPLFAQLSRQVTDLSAAGANLFTALVELQRLRASSERKFQRWFNDTKAEMERQQELVGQMERAIIQERRDRAQDQASWEKLIDGARRTEVNFSRLSAEKDRELQIAKDESRRAWEELGRYEALERERQNALAQGLPVMIGGTTVYPRSYAESRQASLSQPTEVRGETEARPNTRRGPQSASVQNDPFSAVPGAGEATQQTSSPEAVRRSAPPATQAVTASIASPGFASDGGYTTFSSPPAASGTRIYSQSNAPLGYIPSEEDLDYEVDEYGEPLMDESGRPLSYRRGLHEARSSESEGEAQPYTSRGQGPSQRGASSSAGAGDVRTRPRIPATAAEAMAQSRPSMQTRPETDPEFFDDGRMQQEARVSDAEDEDIEDVYSGAGYGPLGGEEEDTHYHPTRLSDVPEEDEASRASEVGSRRGFSGAPF